MTEQPDTPWLRFRVFVGGKLQDETWVDVTSPPADLAEIQVRHVRHVVMAQVLHLPWIVEVYDPDQPEPYAYARYGTDTRGMIDPIEITRNDADGAADMAVLILGGYMRPPSSRIPAYTCPQCGRTSHNPVDVKAGYCGNCHEWTGKTGDTITPEPGRTVNVDDAFANLAAQYDYAPVENLPLPEPEQ